MKNGFVALLMCFFLCLSSAKSFAANPKELEEIEEFQSFPVDVEKDGKLYVGGILLSYSENERYFRIESELKIAEEKIEEYKKAEDRTNKLLVKWDTLASDIENDINKIDALSERTFMEEHGFEVGVASGIVVTIAIFLIATQ